MDLKSKINSWWVKGAIKRKIVEPTTEKDLGKQIPNSLHGENQPTICLICDQNFKGVKQCLEHIQLLHGLQNLFENYHYQIRSPSEETSIHSFQKLHTEAQKKEYSKMNSITQKLNKDFDSESEDEAITKTKLEQWEEQKNQPRPNWYHMPDVSVPMVINKNTFKPDAKSQTPDAESQTPDADSQTPDAESQTPTRREPKIKNGENPEWYRNSAKRKAKGDTHTINTLIQKLKT